MPVTTRQARSNSNPVKSISSDTLSKNELGEKDDELHEVGTIAYGTYGHNENGEFTTTASPSSEQAPFDSSFGSTSSSPSRPNPHSSPSPRRNQNYGPQFRVNPPPVPAYSFTREVRIDTDEASQN